MHSAWTTARVQLAGPLLVCCGSRTQACVDSKFPDGLQAHKVDVLIGGVRVDPVTQ